MKNFSLSVLFETRKGYPTMFWHCVSVVYRKAFDTSRARRTRLRRTYPIQNHNKHHTPGIIVYINE